MKKRFAVIGYPLGHTMSPFIHKRMFELQGIEGDYEAFLTPPDQLAARVEMLKEFDGFNITIPHKKAVIPFLSKLGKTAEIYGAVNTVQNQKGELIGHSTDADGFVLALELEKIPLTGKVLILGSGGVSETIATECLLRGCDVTFGVREKSLDKTQRIVTGLRERFTKTAGVLTLDEIDEEFDLAVNGTPVGMFPETDGCVLTEKQIEKMGYIFDAVYNPENTLLVEKARALGKKAVSGMGMLVMQGAKAEEHWLGVTFKDEDMKGLIADANEEMRRIFGG